MPFARIVTLWAVAPSIQQALLSPDAVCVLSEYFDQVVKIAWQVDAGSVNW